MDLVENTVFNALPDVIAKNFGPQLRNVVKPLVDSIKAKAGTMMDVEASKGLVVHYHKPKEEKKRKSSGTWVGSWQSSVKSRSHGTFVMHIVQTATSLDGTIDIGNSECVSHGTITGRIKDGRIHIGAVEAEQSVSSDGHIKGGHMSGRYSAPSCGDDEGVWAGEQR